MPQGLTRRFSMINTMYLALCCTKIRSVAILSSLILASACGVPGPYSGGSGSSLHSVAILGSTAKIGLKTPVDTSRMSSELAAQLAGLTGVTVTPERAVRKIIGAAPHDEMMAFYARHGHFAPYQIQRLMAANLPSSQVLAVRLESDLVERLPVVRQSVLNAQGMLLADREQRTYATRRITQLSAKLLNLRNGQVAWTRKYRVSPETAVTSNHLVGGSFSTSVAAAVANRLVHGVNDIKHPDPATLADSLVALLREVARNAPVR